MTRIDVTNLVKVYEINGEDVAIGSDTRMTVKSHWNRNEMVRLVIGKTDVTVLAADLRAAITNAENSR